MTGESLRARSTRPRARTSFFGVVGEILITAGIITLLYVVWQLWIGDLIYGAERNATGHDLSEQWAQEYSDPTTAPTSTPTPTSGATAEPVPPVTTGDPIALAQPADAQVFGAMHIPRFGPDYVVPMAGGVTRENTLDPIGIGHYPDTDMPGDVGNFAVAAHRTTWGKPFNRIADLHVGDAIVIETPEGWYTYRFRTLEYVTPSAVDVLLPVPQAPNVPNDGGRYLTMTSCSPMFAMTERIVGYSVFDSFTPRASGPPASLTEGVAS